jgi:hypothetical protein
MPKVFGTKKANRIIKQIINFFADNNLTKQMKNIEIAIRERSVKRHPRETKGINYDVTDVSNELCSTEGCC